MKAPTNRKLKLAKEAVFGAAKLLEKQAAKVGEWRHALEFADEERLEASTNLNRTLREFETQVRIDERNLVRKEPVRQPYQKAPQKAKG